jgi:hypothetical protein
VGQPKTSHGHVEVGEEGEDVLINEYRVWIETGKDKERVWKAKPVSELRV